MSGPPRLEESAIVTLIESPTTDRPVRRPSVARRRLASAPRPIERWFVGGVLLWLLVGPRIELPVAGLRVEDLLLGVLAVVCAAHLRAFSLPRGVSWAVAGVVVTGLISCAVASARGLVDPISSVLYAVRPLEYWIAFPAALLVLQTGGPAWRRRLQTVLAATTILQTAFAVLQYYFQIPVGFSHAAYTRAAGLTVGPYELGAISAALLVYWVASGRWVLASVSVIGLAASIARVSVLGAAVALVVLSAFWTVRQARRVRREGWRTAFSRYARSRVHVVVQVVAVGTAGLVLAFTLGLLTPPTLPAASSVPVAGPVEAAAPSDAAEPTATPEPSGSADAAPEIPAAPSESVATRLADTSVLGSWNVAGEVAAAVPGVRTAAEYQDVAYAHINDHVNAGNAAASGAEPSNLVRFFRWHFILDTIDEPLDVVFGLGPSFVGPSVDGSYLRFFADGGLLGVAAWLLLIVMWLRRSPLWMTCVTISLLVGALFIDIVYAQRPMVLFWLLLATAVSGIRDRSEAAGTGAEAPAEAVRTARPAEVGA